MKLQDGIAEQLGISNAAETEINQGLTRCFTNLLEEEARKAVIENSAGESGYRLASDWLATTREFEKLDQLFEDALEPHVAWALSNAVREHNYGFEQERTVALLIRDGHIYIAEARFDALGRMFQDGEDSINGEARARYSRLIDFEATKKFLLEEQELEQKQE